MIFALKKANSGMEDTSFLINFLTRCIAIK